MDVKYVNDIQKLTALGLSQTQIKTVMDRLQNTSVDLFIQRWKTEKDVMPAAAPQQQPHQQPPLWGEPTRGSHNEALPFMDPSRGQVDSRRASTNENPFMRTHEVNSGRREVPYMPRMIPNPTERPSSEKMNSMYQEQTQSRTDPNSNLDIMSVQLFGSPAGGYTMDYIQKRYRQLAVTLHPDKNGGDGTRFHMLTTCYNHLKQTVLEKAQKYEDTSRTQSSRTRETRPVPAPPPDSLFESKFDPEQFNSYYTKNAFKEPERGYGDWLKSQPDVAQPARPSESSFNSEYEKQKRHVSRTMDPRCLQMIKQPDVPEELNTGSGNCAILGGEDDENTDFTGQTADGTQYTDIRRALEVTHLSYEDTSDVQEQDVSKQFARAQSSRGSAPPKMSAADTEKYKARQQAEVEAEEARRYRLRQYDEDVGEHFKHTHHNRLTMG